MELFWPLILFATLALVRNRELQIFRPDCHLIPKALPSVGGYEFLQNFVCAFLNDCYSYPLQDIYQWKNAGLNKLFSGFKPLLEKYVDSAYANETAPTSPPTSSPQDPSSTTGETNGETEDQNPENDEGIIYRVMQDKEVISALTDLSRFLANYYGVSHLEPTSRDLSEKIKFASKKSDFMRMFFCGLKNNLTTPDPKAPDDPLGPVQPINNKGFLEGTDLGVFVPEDDVPDPKCNTLFETLHSTKISTLAWNSLKPYFRGYLLFVPDNDFTRKVMRKVEDKFAELRSVDASLYKLHNVVARLLNGFRVAPEKFKEYQERLKNPEEADKLFQEIGVKDPEERREMVMLGKMLAEEDWEELLRTLDSFLSDAKNFFACIKYDKIQGFNSEADAEFRASKLTPQHKLWAVIVFEMDQGDISPKKHIKYKIRMDPDRVDVTYPIADRPGKATPRRDPYMELKYITHGFAYIQEYVERSLIEITTQTSLDDIGVFLQQFSFPCYIHDLFIRTVESVFPLFMILSWLFAAAMIIRSVVDEREKHLKEIMKVMGLNNMTIWLGWFIDSFVVLSISGTLLTIILKFGRVCQYTSFSILWVFIISYAVSVICFSFMLSTLFSRANSAAAAGGVIFFLSYIPFYLLKIWIDYGELETHQVLACTLVSNLAFGFGCTLIARLENDGYGLQWDKFKSTSEGYDVDFRYFLGMIWFDSVLYLIITFYIEAVAPGASGIPKPWYFPFLPSTYSCYKKRKQRKASRYIRIPLLPDNESGDANVFQTNSNTSQGMEDEEGEEESEVSGKQSVGNMRKSIWEERIAGVKVRGLSKTYSNGKTGLKNLDIDFYENQITSFLGHNGAGKTTTISILVGLFPPTKGTAYINGVDITLNMAEARKNIGICPQHNILFGRLTVAEHIKFFSGLKGKKLQASQAEIDKILIDLGFPEKRNEFPRKLSGGMKRKLCVAIAFVGQSRTVILDEPTAGVDPYSRRSIWELLLKYKQGRTIVLTTHFMDEADILGDRIAIISRGVLKTCGSGLYLKSHFGEGYTLHLVTRMHTLSKKVEQDGEHQETQELPPEGSAIKAVVQATAPLLLNFVQERIPRAKLESNVGSEVSFILPYDTTPEFAKLFSDLDANMEILGISTYGISDTTLEDVFLKATADDESKSKATIDKGSCSCCCCTHIVDIKTFDEKDSNAGGGITAKSSRCCCPCFKKTSTQEYEPDNVPVAKSAEAEEMFQWKESGNVPLESHTELGEGIESADQLDDFEPGNKPVESDKTNKLQISSGTSMALSAERMQSSSAHRSLDTFRKAYRKTFIKLWISQMGAIILKRIRSSRRNFNALFFELFLPAMFIVFAFAFTMVVPERKTSHYLKVTPYQYKLPVHVFFSDLSENVNGSDSAFKDLIDELTGVYGLGTQCLSDNLERQFCDPMKFDQSKVDEFNVRRKHFNINDAKLGSCDCTRGSQICASVIEKKPPAKLETHASTRIIDVSRYHIADWIVKTYAKYYGYLNGGFQFQINEAYPVNLTYFIDLMDQVTAREFENVSVRGKPDFPQQPYRAVKLWFNNKAYISSIAYLNSLHNMILRNRTSSVEEKRLSGITLYQHPLKLTEAQLARNLSAIKSSVVGLIVATCVVFAFSFVPASFNLYLIEEQACGGKHLHFVAGVKPIFYWIANLINDLLRFLLPVAVCMILFVIFDAQAFISKYSIGACVTLFLLYGWSVIPLMYPASYMFSSPSTAFVVLSCANLFIGIITTITEFVLSTLGDEDLKQIADSFSKFCILFPQYCLGKGIITLLDMQTNAVIQTSLCTIEPDRFLWNHLGKLIFVLALQGFIFFIVIILLDYRRWLWVKIINPGPRFSGDHFENEDEDVRQERTRVMKKEYDPDSVLVAERLTKFYRHKKVPAVNGICVALGQGECFGLLGINGAGKTSTFKMLTGDVSISGGRALIASKDVVLQRDAARTHFGYCPQEDGLDLLLNAFEVLELYGVLRGYKKSDARIIGENLIDTLGLHRHAKRTCGTYSGGNKRKLSTAIALVGDPDIVFLDEPTSGMDPGARRHFWKVVLNLLESNKSVVLTTHSMEECEALCTRVGIMVNGNFVCLGSTQHLKSRFGSGYMLTLRCIKGRKKDLITFMEQSIPAATLEDSHFFQLKYKIPQDQAKLGDVFHVMLTAKDTGLVEEYSMSQTSLDDIFVKFATLQKEEI